MLHRASLSNEATAREVTASASPTCSQHVLVLGAPTDHRDVETEFGHQLREEVGAAQQRLDKGDAGAGTGQGHRDAGQACATADVDDGLVVRDEFRYRGAVEYVSLPEPIHFGWADEPALDTGPGKNADIPFGLWESRTEYADGLWWRRRRLAMFHVKQSSAPGLRTTSM